MYAAVPSIPIVATAVPNNPPPGTALFPRSYEVMIATPM